MTLDFGALDQGGRIRFTNSPVLISVRNRLPWRTGLMCLILSSFNKGQARLDHLHLLTWAVDTDGTRELFRIWLSGARPMDRSTARIDPDLNRTISLAHGLGLVELTNSGKVRLTEGGSALAAELNAVDAIFTVEKRYLGGLGPLNEARLNRVLGALAQ